MRPSERASPRVMIYSHDTFGLGHIRRARTLANALAAELGASVIIVTGSPVVGSFEFGKGVDYVRLPGVVKQASGDYTARSLGMSLQTSVALREGLIRQTAESFSPDILIVDKEPTGFHGEILPTLDLVRRRGGRTVLGVRDVLDDGAALRAEWQRKGALAALVNCYDNILVYGLAAIYEPLAALGLPQEVVSRITYTGYLRREPPSRPTMMVYPAFTEDDFLLVTAGGGGDGTALMEWVIAAFEADDALPLPALLVYGPFIPREERRKLTERVARLGKVEALAFDAKLEHLMEKAAGVVAMGGYNTFCEILSLDKKALIVPRVRPRLEQSIRAHRAAALGLCAVLEESQEPHIAPDPRVMAAALRALPLQAPPSTVGGAELLAGLENVLERMRNWLANPPLRSPAALRLVGG